MTKRKENAQGLILAQMESTKLSEKNKGSVTKACLLWNKTTLKRHILMSRKESKLNRDLIPGFQKDNPMKFYQG